MEQPISIVLTRAIEGSSEKVNKFKFKIEQLKEKIIVSNFCNHQIAKALHQRYGYGSMATGQFITR